MSADTELSRCYIGKLAEKKRKVVNNNRDSPEDLHGIIQCHVESTAAVTIEPDGQCTPAKEQA